VELGAVVAGGRWFGWFLLCGVGNVGRL